MNRSVSTPLVLVLGLALASTACDALRSFGPDRVEREAMEGRLAALRDADTAPSFTVYPVRIRTRVDPAEGKALAARIEALGLGSATALDEGPWFELRPSVNEQSPLWEMAREFRDHVREHPLSAGYALYADYFLNEEAGSVLAVHFALCDRTGEWVLVDFQNSHWPDFQEVAPRSTEDCRRLVTIRLERALSGSGP